jgi:FtsH-binding integral membrane protein
VSSNYENYRNVSSDTKIVANSIFRGAYIWMFFGLAVTAAVSYFLIATAAGNEIFRSMATALSRSSVGFIILAVAQIALVLFLAARIHHISTAAAVLLFALYAMTIGITLTFYTAFFGLHTIYKAFFAAMAFFGSATLFGLFTKRDLSSVGRIAISALIAIIIVSVINFFMRSPAIDYIVSYIGVGVFTLLTAYDAQKIKLMAQSVAEQGSGAAVNYTKFSIIAALNLYLDFINLFFFLIRIFGGSQRN